MKNEAMNCGHIALAREGWISITGEVMSVNQ
jgi:hypothetical protein